MSESEGSYSIWTGSVLIFNAVVGMGIWTLPKLIYDTGTISSFLILAFSAFFSFVIASFIMELQGSGNAIKKLGLSQAQVKSFRCYWV